ncbi:hypothetical protein MKX01_014561 [Papaver californicum]|nr:hypothetical protein MKX01_014561 [Papaver californicum]
MAASILFSSTNATALYLYGKGRVGSNSVAVSKSIILSFPVQYKDLSWYIHPRENICPTSTAASNQRCASLYSFLSSITQPN